MSGPRQTDALVVGAGPVGMMAALAMHRQGAHVEVMEMGDGPGTHSYALCLHPASLDLMAAYGLLERIMEKARVVQKIGLYDRSERQAEIDLRELGLAHPYLAVVRQSDLEFLLAEVLRENGIHIRWNHRLTSLQALEQGAEVRFDQLEETMTGYAVAHLEPSVKRSAQMRAAFVLGADGHASAVRRWLAIDFPEVAPRQTFAVFEFHTDAEPDPEMRIVVDEAGQTSVLWPLPGKACRWSFEIGRNESDEYSRTKDHEWAHLGSGGFPMISETALKLFMENRAPWFNCKIEEIRWRVSVRFEKRLAASFGQKRVWLAGDAAHMAGPVGVQSMNVGLREADRIAALAIDALNYADTDKRLADYEVAIRGEWEQLLGMQPSFEPSETASSWLRSAYKTLLPCLPGSDQSLAAMAKQLGLEPAMVEAG